MNRFLAALIVWLLVATAPPALAQTPAHAVAIGKGGGQTGFNYAAPGPAGQSLVSNGPGIDPTFQAPSANGGQCYNYTAVGGDNTSALNSAITAAIAANQTLCLPGGTIQISGTLNLASNLRMRGAGLDVTILQKTASTAAVTMLALCPAATSNIILSDFTLDMNASTIASQFYGIGCSQGISGFLLERTKTKNPYNGGLLEITGDGTTPTVPNGKQINSNIIIRDNIFDCSTNTVTNNGDCVNPLWIDGLWFINNEAIGGQANLLSFEFNRHFLIAGNKIHGGWRNLYMETSQDGTIRDNEIYTTNATSANGNVTAYGIWMADANQTYSGGGYAGSSRVLVTGNHIHDLTRSTGSAGVQCIAVSAPGTTLAAKDITIEANTCFNSGVTDNSGTTTGVQLEGGLDTVSVQRNEFRTLAATSIGVTPNAAYTAPGESAAQTQTNMLVYNNLCTGVGTCQAATFNAPALPLPQGRLTLQIGVPVMITNQTAKATLYYDCFEGGRAVPYFDGSSDLIDTIASCEVSTAMQSSSTGVLNNAGVFDAWWVHSGANRICVATNGSGGGWASDTAGSATARGTGYTQLDTTTRAFITNKNAITHCYNGATDYGSVAANQATYLGTIYTSAAGQVSWSLGGSAAGGTGGQLFVWNAYNRRQARSSSVNSTATWTYSTATPRAPNGASGMQAAFVSGLAEDSIQASYNIQMQTAGTVNAAGSIGVALDATNALDISALCLTPAASANYCHFATPKFYVPQLGSHFISAIENGDGSTTTTFSAADAAHNSFDFVGRF